MGVINLDTCRVEKWGGEEGRGREGGREGGDKKVSRVDIRFATSLQGKK